MGTQRKYDLKERTARFAEDIISIVKTIRQDPINKRIIEQVVGSAGSIGANYSEATEAESRRDFVHKLGIAKKEIKETQHWLRLLAKSNPDKRLLLIQEWKEAQQLLLIFSSSIITARSKMPDLR